MERLISDLFSTDFHKHYDNKSSKWLSAGLQSKPWVSSCTKLLLTEIRIWKWPLQLWTLLKQWWKYCRAWKNFWLVWDLHPWIHRSWVTSHGFKSRTGLNFFQALFSLLLILIISIHNCEDCFHIRFFNHSSHIWFSNIYSHLLAEIHSKLLEFDLNLK